MEPGSWTGRWWLPATPEHPVGGTLTFTDEDFALVLDKPLVAPSMEPGEVFHQLVAPTRHQLVYGTVDDGRPVTLVDVSGNALLIPFATGSESWRPRCGFVGVALSDPEGAVFTSATIAIENLNEWLGSRQPALTFRYSETRELMYASTEAERATVHHAAISWGSVEAVTQLRVNVKGPSATLSLLDRLQVTSDSPVSWNTIWVDRVVPLLQLLVVSLGRRCSVETLHLAADGSDKPVLALFRTPDQLSESPARRISTHDFLLTPDNMPESFDSTINKWYVLCAEHRVAMRELFDTLRSPERFISDQLVSLVRVIGPLTDEAQAAAATDAADREFAAWLVKVGEQISDPDIRAAVLGKLGQSSTSDRNRLSAIATSLGVAGEYLCGGDIARFAQRVVATRVGTAHPSSRTPKHALEGAALVQHTLALSWLLRCAVLARVGVPLDGLLDRLQNSGASHVGPAD